MTSESAKTSEKEEKEEEPTYEKAIYLIVRNDLKMGKGKIAAQCCHAVQSIVRACPDALYREYEKNGCAKICLKVESEEEFAALAKSLTAAGIVPRVVVDAGRTQIAPNTSTCMGVGPISKQEIQKHVQHLKLL